MRRFKAECDCECTCEEEVKVDIDASDVWWLIYHAQKIIRIVNLEPHEFDRKLVAAEAQYIVNALENKLG